MVDRQEWKERVLQDDLVGRDAEVRLTIIHHYCVR